ncbi:EXS family protein [Cryptosporidium felis]|nr:EXS family protein [Cryptosporidium felis]
MKFVDKFEIFETTRWGGKFLSYRALVYSLNSCYFDYLNTIGKDQQFSSPSIKELNDNSDIPYKILAKAIPDKIVLKLDEFHSFLKKNIETVVTHYKQIKLDNDEHLDSISSLLEDNSAPISAKLHLPNTILDIWKTYDDLQEYLLINKLAVMKLCLKRDELFDFYQNDLPSSDYLTSDFKELDIGSYTQRITALYSKSKELTSPSNDNLKISSTKNELNVNILFNRVNSQADVQKSSFFELEALMEYGLKTKKTFGKSLFNPDFTIELIRDLSPTSD